MLLYTCNILNKISNKHEVYANPPRKYPSYKRIVQVTPRYAKPRTQEPSPERAPQKIQASAGEIERKLSKIRIEQKRRRLR